VYRTVDTSFWTDPDVRKLPASSKYLLLYLITNPHAHVGGIYYLPDIIAAHDTGIEIDKLKTLYDTLTKAKTDRVSIPLPAQDSVGFIRRDSKMEVIWVVNMLTYQGKGEKILRSVASHLKTLHNCPIINDFVKHYPSVKRFYRHRVSDAPSRVGTQEQEQEQESSAAAAAGTDPPLKKSPGDSDELRKPRKQPAGDHHELIRFFMDGWRRRYGADYVFVEGKDGAAVRWILEKSGGIDAAKKIVESYLASDEPFVADKHHPVALLRSQINKFRGTPSHAAAGSNGARTVKF
jgi:hypothetical protein